MKHFGNYQIIYQFLLKKKHIENIDFKKSMHTTLIDSGIYDFFWSESQKFVKYVIKSNS